MKNLYCQCLLRQAGRYTVGFIPAKFATIGKIVRIEFATGWEDGWRVESAGGLVPKTDVDLYSRQHRSQRLGSDI